MCWAGSEMEMDARVRRCPCPRLVRRVHGALCDATQLERGSPTLSFPRMPPRASAGPCSLFPRVIVIVWGASCSQRMLAITDTDVPSKASFLRIGAAFRYRRIRVRPWNVLLHPTCTPALLVVEQHHPWVLHVEAGRLASRHPFVPPRQRSWGPVG